MTLSEIRRHLEERGMRPLNRFGQNFLHDQNLIEAILTEALAELAPGSAVLEVGPGLGALTEGVLRRGFSVTALEIDRGLAVFLRERFDQETQQARFRLIEGDALDTLKVWQEGGRIEGAAFQAPRLFLGNLPYNISTPLLARALALPEPPDRMVLTLQREVAERLAARCGSAAYGSLSITTQVEYTVRLVRHLPPSVFYPVPEVDSAVVRLDRLAILPIPIQERVEFQGFVRKGFSQRRKKLSNTLGIAESRRAEELSVEEWVAAWRQWREANKESKD